MPEVLSKLLQKASDFWKNLDKSQKTRLYITAAIIAASFVIGIVLMTKPNHIILIREAAEKDVKAMTDVLNSNNIWNEVGDDGRSIIINMKDKGAAKMALAGEDYPKNGLTFEDAVSMIGIGSTESDKKRIWNQQKKSEIEAMLELDENVVEAEVLLALPERSSFLIPDQPQMKPTAHVTVKPRSTITPSQARVIQMAVAHSVEGLDPNDVTVVDNNLNLLNVETDDNSIDMANSQEKLRLERENNLQKKVYEYFGYAQFDSFDSLRVVANAVLDFDKEKSQEKILDFPGGGDSGVTVSEHTKNINLENGSVNGVPGTDTNPGDTPAYQFGENGNSTYEEKERDVNYGYNERLVDREKSTGKLVPEESSLAISLWYGKRVLDDTGLTDEFVDQLKVAASSATGIPAKNISINKLKLSQPAVETKSTADMVRELINDYGFFALMLILIIGLMFAMVPRKKKDEEDAIEDLQPAMASGPRFVVPEHMSESLPEIDLEERSEVKKQLEKFVKQKPDAVAQLLRNWLSDDWDM